MSRAAAQRLADAEASVRLSPEEELEVLKKVQKLMQVEGRTPEETALYAQKAQDLILAYNLDVSRTGELSEGGARKKESLVGGFYEFQRSIWHWVAELNFCLYWSDWVRVERTKFDARTDSYSWRNRKWRRERRHTLVGRTVNVQATIAMATYLLEAIERECVDWLGDMRAPGDLRSRRAVSFREGAAENITDRLWARRQEQVSEERRRRREQDAQATASASTSTALTIADVRQFEEDANRDFIMGEGWSARQRQAREDAARRAREAMEAYTRWAEANPEEAAAKEREREKAERRRAPRSTREPREKDRDWGAFSQGESAGARIGLEQQVSERRDRALPSR